MNGWLLDTNVIAEIARNGGEPEVRDWARRQDEDRLYISVVTLAEYDKGVANLPVDSPARGHIEALVAALEARFAGRVLSVTDEIVRRWGRVSGTVQRATGTAPPVIDTLLAATAIEHDLCLVTRNVKDVRDSGATVLDPWSGDADGFEPT